MYRIFFLLLLPLQLPAQTTRLQEGNRAYKAGDYPAAAAAYRQALAGGGAPPAQYNLGNALFQQQVFDEALAAYEAVIAAGNRNLRVKALYNKGVVHHNRNELPAAIEAYKEALRLAPGDAEIRTNLQLALTARRKQQQQEQQQQQPQPKEQQQPQPCPAASKLNRRQAEQYLKALEQKERELQEKMQKKAGGLAQPDKEW